ncbi:MAG: B12-binding domain-containing radical SAM protein, partial [Tissierellia bacterium]|nr:B12-binding domain-containing radical SAM protein [Tissierellia bacterium]
YDDWIDALDELNIDGSFYANRHREFSENLAWDFINPGPSKEYLINEYKRSLNAETTEDCRLGCKACGIDDCAMWGVFN